MCERDARIRSNTMNGRTWTYGCPGRSKDGRTHSAHKAEHAVDLETGAVVGVTVQDADKGDTTTSIETLIEAAEQVEAVRPDGDDIEEVIGDKGYHSNQSLVDLEAVGVRSYISEPDRGRRNWKKNFDATPCIAIVGAFAARGQRLLRLRGERLERPFAHLYETGGMRRVYLRGQYQHPEAIADPRRRLQSRTPHAAADRRRHVARAAGTGHRGLGRSSDADSASLGTRHWPPVRLFSPLERLSIVRYATAQIDARETAFTTGC